MNLNKPAVIKKLQERFRNVNAGRGLYTAFLVPTMLTMFSTRAFAADTIWTKASAIMQDVYTQILGISTIAAVVTAAIALLLMNFSRSGRTVDESRAWLKRIIITWAILNSLGFTMMKIADFLAGLYGDIVDRSLLLAGTFLHDFGKQQEFTLSQLGLVTDYSVKGQLLGHLVIGAQEVAKLAAEMGMSEDKSVLLQHMILSHHGEPEFGAAVKPICAESELLSQIDMIDSRMEIYRETLQDLRVGEVSNRIFALDKRVYKHF